MASPVPSPVPSSSANTIPIAGKSILKRPPQSQQSILSRIRGFLPTQSPNPSNESTPLKRAHFILPQIATVYPISSINPPSTSTSREEKKAIEDREAERRKRVVRGNSISPGANETEDWWNLDKANLKGGANPKFNAKLWSELTYHGGFHKVFCPSISQASVFLVV